MLRPPMRLIWWFSGLILVPCLGLAVALWAGWLPNPTKKEDSRPGAAEEPAPPMLDKGEREYLWQAEHHHLLLSRYGFTPLASALSQGNAPKLRSFLASSFVAQIPSRARRVRLASNDFAEVVREQDNGESPKVLKAEQFVARLLHYRKHFSRPPKVKVSVKTLHPARRKAIEGPWQGTCVVRLWDEECKHCAAGTNPSALAQKQMFPVEVMLTLGFRLKQPTKKNLGQPGWLESCSLTQSLLARARVPRFLMREVAAERGIDTKRFHDNWLSDEKNVVTGGVYVCDFNRDGLLDLLVIDLNCIVLYQGLPGGKFKDVTSDMGLPGFPAEDGPVKLLATFVDIDGDGWDDLILGYRVYRNVQGKKFEDYSSRTNLELPVDAGSIALADFDRDGRVDLYVTRPGKGAVGSWLDGKSGSKQGNQLWRNLGNWQFENVTERSGTSGGQRSTFSAVWLDANNDGWPDLYVINEFGNGVLLINQGDGTFRQHMLTQGPCDFGTMGVTCGDIDNDGNIDIYAANMYSKAGMRVFSNLRQDAYRKKIMTTMRRFVTGSQLHRNQGSSNSNRWARPGR